MTIIVVRKKVNYSKQNYNLSGEQEFRGNKGPNLGVLSMYQGTISENCHNVTDIGRVFERNGTQECSINTRHPGLE